MASHNPAASAEYDRLFAKAQRDEYAETILNPHSIRAALYNRGMLGWRVVDNGRGGTLVAPPKFPLDTRAGK